MESKLVMSVRIPNAHFTFRNVSVLADMQNKVFTDIMSFSRYIFFKLIN